MIFNNAKYYDELPPSDAYLKEFLNYNPVHNSYTRRQNLPGRDPNETDRGGWRGYDRVYTEYFSPLKNEKLNILEIGIKEGYGIYAWQKYFQNSTLYGIDIDWSIDIIQQRNKIKSDHPYFRKAKLYNLDSTQEDHWLQFYGKEFDIIIDDGDHHPETQIKTFNCAWKYLKSQGLYFIEDVGHKYGEEELEELSKVILSRSEEFEEIEVYYHYNTGIQVWLDIAKKDKVYAERNRIKNSNASTKEYIVAIRKK